MRYITDHSSDYLFDPWEYIQGKRRRLLEGSWAKVVRTHLLDALPVEEIAAGFHEVMGRPSKELHTMLGVLTLQQMLDLTDRETTDALAFDVRWHYALDITDESDAGKYVCERTLRNYRTKMIDLRLDEVLFTGLTDKLLEAFGVDASKQRIDSTHICSNMRNLGRVGLFARTIKGFLRDLKREHAERLDRVERELAGRYLKEEELGCFSQTKPSQAKRCLKVLSEDLFTLVRLFEGDQEVMGMESYGLLQRLLSEQCEVSQGGEDDGEGERDQGPGEAGEGSGVGQFAEPVGSGCDLRRSQGAGVSGADHGDVSTHAGRGRRGSGESARRAGLDCECCRGKGARK